jgi:hypothetical protein
MNLSPVMLQNVSLTGPMEDDKGLIKKVSKWKRVHEITSNPQLFIDGTEEGDVNQGGLGDCWFIGAMSVVAIKPHLIVIIPIFHTPETRFYGRQC